MIEKKGEMRMETPMRRGDRAVTTFREQMEILARCRVCRLALRDEEGPYLVPLNFGFTSRGEQLTLYFHSAKEGRKLRAIAADPLVAFELDTDHRLVVADRPCSFGFDYACLTGTGRAELVEDPDEKCRALSLLMYQQTGQLFSFTQQQADAVAVIRLRVERMTGKLCTR